MSFNASDARELRKAAGRRLAAALGALRHAGDLCPAVYSSRKAVKQVEELALQSMIRAREQSATGASSSAAEETRRALGQMDNEAAINQTELHLSLQGREEEEEEEEEESDS
ncbi:snRNA-activating protein complex subunit 5 [Athene cunicularia]|uniref:snRNA-activating protein complex subunit 5 n=1 Tax=Athene cunicularia TaxID=194338 RepID=UPI000EF6F3A2|nr:snRNA-activating protein complex subunit 5 [Athene cunicularia]